MTYILVYAMKNLHTNLHFTLGWWRNCSRFTWE